MTTTNLLEMNLDALSLNEMESIEGGGGIWGHVLALVAGAVSALIW